MKTYMLGDANYTFTVTMREEVRPAVIIQSVQDQNRELIAKSGQIGVEATPFNREPVALAFFMLTSNAFDERDRRIETLERRIDDLSREISALESRIEKENGR